MKSSGRVFTATLLIVVFFVFSAAAQQNVRDLLNIERSASLNFLSLSGKLFSFKSTSASRPAQIFDVAVNNNFYSSGNVSIQIGDTVRWTWITSRPHTVTGGTCVGNDCAADDSFCSPSNTDCASAPASVNGAIYTYTFNEPGVYPYFCTIHGSMMTAVVTVNAPTAASVSVGGRVRHSRGKGIMRAQVSLTDSSGAVRQTSTDFYGRYRFNDVPAGETYVIAVSHRFVQFEQNTQVRFVGEDDFGIDFVAID